MAGAGMVCAEKVIGSKSYSPPSFRIFNEKLTLALLSAHQRPQRYGWACDVQAADGNW